MGEPPPQIEAPPHQQDISGPLRSVADISGVADSQLVDTDDNESEGPRHPADGASVPITRRPSATTTTMGNPSGSGAAETAGGEPQHTDDDIDQGMTWRAKDIADAYAEFIVSEPDIALESIAQATDMASACACGY